MNSNKKNFYIYENHSLIYEEYLPIFIFLIIAFVFSVLLVFFSIYLVTQKPETEKLSTYECGFEPHESSRHVFDIKFCMVAVLFIVFDVETIFFFPWATSLSQLSLTGFWSMIDFITELGVGLIYVWHLKALDWN